MLQHTSMSLNDIRSMDNSDFQIHLRLLLYFREVEAKASQPKKKASADDILRGSKKGQGPGKFTVNKRIDPETGQWKEI